MAQAKLKTYSVIRRDKEWHLTQRQARPPEKSELGCNTVCGVWANMKDGYERGMPTCSTCLHAIVEYEMKQPVPWADPATGDFEGRNVDCDYRPGDEKLVRPEDGPDSPQWGEVFGRPRVNAPHFSVGSRRRRRGG